MQDSLTVGVAVGVVCGLLVVVITITVLLVIIRVKATINLRSETQNVEMVPNHAYTANSTQNLEMVPNHAYTANSVATDSQPQGSYEMTAFTSSMEDNAAYETNPNFPVEANAAYETTTSDTDQL